MHEWDAVCDWHCSKLSAASHLQRHWGMLLEITWAQVTCVEVKDYSPLRGTLHVNLWVGLSMLLPYIAKPFFMIWSLKEFFFSFFFCRCAGAGYTSRWYHMSDGEHFCNACFDYMYRRSVTCQWKVPLPHFVNIIPLKCTLG